MAALTITSTHVGDATVLSLVGSASMLEVDRLSRETDRCAAGRPKKLIVDMTRLDFLASLAIGQIVAMTKSVKMHGGTVVLAGPNGDVAEVLRRCNLSAIVPVVSSVEAALAA
jgi:anti-anti-sigma factor